MRPEQENTMKLHTKQAVFALVPVAWLCLLASCTPATGVDSAAGGTESADTPATTAAPGEDQADAKPTDIIDRMFSPLDNAVDDINRDLNQGDADTTSGSTE
jgi:hypothetical protein